MNCTTPLLLSWVSDWGRWWGGQLPFVLIKRSDRQMYLHSQGTTWFRVGVNRQKQHLEPREWVRLMIPLGERGGLVSKHSQQDQTLPSRGAGFQEHPWGLREPMFLVLEAGDVQKLYSGKVRCEALLREEVGQCSRELSLPICLGVCSRRGIAVK